MKINFKDLSFFTYSMNSCLSSGLSIEKSLELCGLKSGSSTLRKIAAPTIENIKEGMLLHEALLPYAHKFPPFFIPVIRCGEESGRLGEIFRYLSDFLLKLEPLKKTIRRTWLNPLIILSFGRIVPIIFCLFFHKFTLAWSFFYPSIPILVGLVVGLYLAFKIEPVKRIIDWSLLQIPLISETIVSLSTAVFLKSFSVMYKTAEMPVAEMIRLSIDTVANSTLRKDFDAIHEAILDRHTFADAFDQSYWLKQTHKDHITAGELAGTLDKQIDQSVQSAADDLMFRLETFNALSHRLLAYATTGALALTLYGIFKVHQ